MEIFKIRRFTAAGLGHFTVDTLNGVRNVLLAYLSGPLGLTNASVATIGMVYSLVAAIVQPFAGHFTDKYGAKWVSALGVIWMVVFFSIGMLLPGWLGLVFFIISSIGSGIFHPAGTVEATKIGQLQPHGRETTSTSLYFFFGQFGFFLGPILAGAILDLWGQRGLFFLGVLGSFTIFYILSAFKTRTTIDRDSEEQQKAAAHAPVDKKPLWYVVALVYIIAVDSLTGTNMSLFVPKYLNDLGHPASFYGFLSALYIGAGAFGNIFGGWLADHLNRNLVITLFFLAASIPLFLVGYLGYSTLYFLLLPLAGFLVGAVYSSLIVLAQKLVPGRMALASGLTLGFMFASGAIGSSLCGILADHYGIISVFYLTSALVLIAGLLSALMIKRKPTLIAP